MCLFLDFCLGSCLSGSLLACLSLILSHAYTLGSPHLGVPSVSNTHTWVLTQAHTCETPCPELLATPCCVQPPRLYLFSVPPATVGVGVRGVLRASPSGRATLILSTASRFWTSLWMLWARVGLCSRILVLLDSALNTHSCRRKTLDNLPANHFLHGLAGVSHSGN